MTADDPRVDERLEAVLASRRLEERLLHLRYYRDEEPAESLRLGLELSQAALETRQAEGAAG
jgi:hypothetical protein